MSTAICPFCKHDSTCLFKHTGHYVLCDNVFCGFRGPIEETANDAILSWNTIARVMKEANHDN